MRTENHLKHVNRNSKYLVVDVSCKVENYRSESNCNFVTQFPCSVSSKQTNKVEILSFPLYHLFLVFYLREVSVPLARYGTINLQFL